MGTDDSPSNTGHRVVPAVQQTAHGEISTSWGDDGEEEVDAGGSNIAKIGSWDGRAVGSCKR